MKIFISQPMRGKTDKQIKLERKDAIAKAKDVLGEEVEIIDSYFEEYNPNNGCIPMKYLAKSIELLADADIVCFANGWQDARGCVIERECAVRYGIPIYYLDRRKGDTTK